MVAKGAQYNNIERIIKSTVHIVMSDPDTFMPTGIGSGCLANYKNRTILLTVAHVTNKKAATCIIVDRSADNGQPLLYSVGAMNYLEQFDITKYEEQIKKFEDDSVKIEDKDFGLIDFSYAEIKEKVNFAQKEIKFKEFTIKNGKKESVNTNLNDIPKGSEEYGFFGRIKPFIIKGDQNYFETQESFYGGLKYLKKIGCYYLFELPIPILDHADFEGTSGAPIMDSKGRIISLVTHGYRGSKTIFGIALADFRSTIDSAILANNL